MNWELQELKQKAYETTVYYYEQYLKAEQDRKFDLLRVEKTHSQYCAASNMFEDMFDEEFQLTDEDRKVINRRYSIGVDTV